MITTYDDLYCPAAVERAVRDGRLRHADPELMGSDGMSRGHFLDLTVEDRVAMIEADVAAHAGWSPLIRVEIPKGYGKEGTRPISYPTTRDAVRLMILADWLGAYAETVLTPRAVGFRHGLAMDETLRTAIAAARKRGLRVVVVADVKSFFDRVGWRHLDRVIGGLPADDIIRAHLRAAVRADVIDRCTGSPVHRTSGTPQGLAISPTLSNLVLDVVDRRLQPVVAPSGGIILRYADDICLLMPSVPEAERAVGVLRDQLGQLGLEIKAGTGKVIDLRASGASAQWLGVELRLNPKGVLMPTIPPTAITGKAIEIRAEMQSGVLSGRGVENRIAGLHHYYAQLVPLHEATQAIQEIRDFVHRNETARKEVFLFT